MHFVVICAKLTFYLTIRFKKVFHLSILLSFKIPVVVIYHYHLSRRSRVALWHRLLLICVSKQHWSGIQEFT